MKKKKINKLSVTTFKPSTNIVFSIFMAIIGFLGIFPFLFIIILSFTEETSIIEHGYRLIPRAISLDGYRYLFSQGDKIWNAFLVTIMVTVLGTLVNVTFTSTYAYALSRSNFMFRKIFMVLIIIPMLVGAGLVPSYIVVSNVLNLKNTIWALILPAALSPFNVIIMRTFYRKTIPEAILDSARIDGANEFQIFGRIVLPLAVPGIATISLFAAIGFWNDWFNALLYITKESLMPLQYVLMNIQNNINYLTENASLGSAVLGGVEIPKEATRMAMVVVSTLPIALSYPFFQKYFISGLTIGGVKE